MLLPPTCPSSPQLAHPPPNLPIIIVWCFNPMFSQWPKKIQTQPTQNARNITQILRKNHKRSQQKKPSILLMEEILHQLIGSLPHYLQGVIHPRWLINHNHTRKLPSFCLFCHVTVLGPKCPSILAILRLTNSTLPIYMLARGTWVQDTTKHR